MESTPPPSKHVVEQRVMSSQVRRKYFKKFLKGYLAGRSKVKIIRNATEDPNFKSIKTKVIREKNIRKGKQIQLKTKIKTRRLIKMALEELFG